MNSSMIVTCQAPDNSVAVSRGEDGKIVVGDTVLVRRMVVGGDDTSLQLCVVERGQRRNLFCRGTPADNSKMKVSASNVLDFFIRELNGNVK